MQEGGGSTQPRRALASIGAAVLLALVAWWATLPPDIEAPAVATVAPTPPPVPARAPVRLRRPANTEAGGDLGREKAGEALGRAVTEMAAERVADVGEQGGADAAPPGDDATVPEMPMAAMRDSIVSGLLSCLSGDGPEVTRVDAEISLSIDDAGLASVDLLFPTEVEPPPGFAECATEVYWAEAWPRSDTPSTSTISVSLAAGG